MKKFQIGLFALVLFATSALVVSCNKDSFTGSAIPETQDRFSNDADENIVEETFEMQEDEFYDPEAVTVNVTGPTKALDSDANGGCTTVKESFKKAFKVSGSPVTLNLAFDKNVGITGITNTNTKTGATGTNGAGQKLVFGTPAMGADSMHWTVTITASDTFRLFSAKMTIAYTELSSKMIPTAKTKNVTVPCVGENSNGLFATQSWGYAYEGGTKSLTATPTAIDSNWIPAVGDMVCFGSQKRGHIISVETPVAAGTSAAAIAKGAKHKFRYVIWDATCKGSRKAANITKYLKVLPTTTVDGTATLTGFVR
jgi:hypothetical protein